MEVPTIHTVKDPMTPDMVCFQQLESLLDHRAHAKAASPPEKSPESNINFSPPSVVPESDTIKREKFGVDDGNDVLNQVLIYPGVKTEFIENECFKNENGTESQISFEQCLVPELILKTEAGAFETNTIEGKNPPIALVHIYSEKSSEHYKSSSIPLVQQFDELKSHEPVLLDGRPFKCNECSFSACLRFQLDMHYTRNHPKQPDDNFLALDMGTKPLKSDEEWFKCSECPYSTSMKLCLVGHQVLKHPVLYNSLQLLVKEHKHSKAASEKPKHVKLKIFKCSKCPYASYSVTQFAKHQLLKHSSTKLLQHSECSFAASSEKPASKKSKHDKVKLFKCSKCPYSSYSEKWLAKHQLKHSSKKLLQCSECSGAYYSERGLKWHKTRKRPVKL